MEIEECFFIMVDVNIDFEDELEIIFIDKIVMYKYMDLFLVFV